MKKSIFNKSVLLEFDFLQKDYGYNCIKSGCNYLKFESNKVCIIINYDNQRSFEVNFIIGLLGETNNTLQTSYEISEILRCLNNTKINQAIQSNNIKEIPRLLNKLALIVKKYLRDFLLGKKQTYKLLSEYIQKESEKHILNLKLSDVRKTAKTMWNLKNYSEVVTLYESMGSYLKPSEIKKMNYAKKHIKK